MPTRTHREPLLDAKESPTSAPLLGPVDFGSNSVAQEGLAGPAAEPSLLESAVRSIAPQDRSVVKTTAGSIKKVASRVGATRTSKVAGVAGNAVGALNAVDGLVTGEEVQARDALTLGKEVTNGAAGVVDVLTKKAPLEEIEDLAVLDKIARNKKWSKRLANQGKALSGVLGGISFTDAIRDGDVEGAVKSGASMSSDLLGLASSVTDSKLLGNLGGGIGMIPALVNLSNSKTTEDLALNVANSGSSMLGFAGTAIGSTALTSAGSVIGAGALGWELGQMLNAAAGSDAAKSFYDGGPTMTDRAIDAAVATNMAFDQAGDSTQHWLSDRGMDGLGSFANSVIDGTGFALGAGQTVVSSVGSTLMDTGAAAWQWMTGGDKKKAPEAGR